MTRRALYAGVGAALSLGAPLGLLALRAAEASRLSWQWLVGELEADRSTYAYVCGSTLIAFTLFGLVLGRQADRLLALSTTDALTGLHNRRALLERLQHELARAERYPQPLSLLLIDVDGLKALNDRSGHRAGDAALLQVAAAIRSGSRASDLASRFGGDEFVMLAPNAGGEAALRLAERVRTSLAGSGGAATGRVTVSVGIATLDADSPRPEPEQLLRAADAALYDAKRAGKDRVVARVWANPPAPPAAG